ncbi:MAG: hypothetical protein KDC38_14845 [Planctomycetes bacterium]|nr:hypothetical protein [Planctomycetota bacterium]
MGYWIALLLCALIVAARRAELEAATSMRRGVTPGSPDEMRPARPPAERCIWTSLLGPCALVVLLTGSLLEIALRRILGAGH